jgi:TorA maturation chaperone TorD
LFESAHDKTHPAQEIALENTFFYEVLQLQADPQQAVPDYLITQLEFLSALRYVVESTADAQTAESLLRLEVDFVERHLRNWLPSAHRKLSRVDAHEFSVLMHLLTQAISTTPANHCRVAPAEAEQARLAPNIDM